MSPVYFLNPGGGGGVSSSSFPLEELEEDQQQLHLFLSPPSSSLITARDPRPSLLPGEKPEQHDQYPQGLQYYGNSSGDHHPRHHPRSSSSFQTFVNGSTNDSHKFSSSEALEDNKEDRERRRGDDGSSREWMPSKMRLMQKTMSSSGSLTTSDDKTTKLTLKIQDQRYHVNEISMSSSSNYNSQNSTTTPAIRVCSDCNTTTTPLWRSGPCGPKSLCNACGIRQRKARRAAATAAENGAVMSVEASSSSMANHKSQDHKEKKPRTGNNIGHSKKSSTKPPEKKLCLKKFALCLSNNSGSRGVFSRDVEEAAILLMELSYGFVPS